MIIDITGPDGNAFAIMAYAKRLYRQLVKEGVPPDASLDDIFKEMKSGNYDHLLDTFEKYFGDYAEIVGR